MTNTENGCTSESDVVVVVNLIHSDFDVTGAVVEDTQGNTNTGSIVPIVVGGVEPYSYQ